MKKFYILMTLLILTFLIGCGGSVDDNTNIEPTYTAIERADTEEECVQKVKDIQKKMEDFNMMILEFNVLYCYVNSFSNLYHYRIKIVAIDKEKFIKTCK